jgi:hypothetical protein
MQARNRGRHNKRGAAHGAATRFVYVYPINPQFVRFCTGNSARMFRCVAIFAIYAGLEADWWFICLWVYL